jgi:hypothetical protein
LAEKLPKLVPKQNILNIVAILAGPS